MSQVFTDAYSSLLRLKDSDANKTCILLSPSTQRACELIDTFKMLRHETVSSFRFSELLSRLSPHGKPHTNRSISATKSYLLAGDPDYIVVIDQRDTDEVYKNVNTLLDILLEVGKDTPVVIISPVGMEMAMFSDDFIVIDVLGKNETSLKIQPSGEETEWIYKRNCNTALESGIFYTNEDIFDNFLIKLLHGDSLFEKSLYSEALSLYFMAYYYHMTYSFHQRVHRMNQFLTLVVLTRILACLYCEENEDNIELRNKIKIRANFTMNKLNSDTFPPQHERLFSDHRRFFLSIKEGNVPLPEYILFLHDFVF